MQERTSHVFIVATANNIQQLPIELLRKGRFDEIFHIDLPVKKERKEIIRIHLRKRGHTPFSSKQMNILADLSREFSGAELETCIVEALTTAYLRDKILTPDDIRLAITQTEPLARKRHEEIQTNRELAKTYGRPASSQPADNMPADRIPDPAYQ